MAEVPGTQALGLYQPMAPRGISAATQHATQLATQANRPDELPAALAPLDVVPMGNYAVSISWSDGHQSLLPYRSFVEGYGA